MKSTARLYECSLWHSGSPVIMEGRPLTEEIIAKSAGAARMSWWRSIRESWEDVSLTQIRVRSLAKRPGPAMKDGYTKRLKIANEIIRVIGSHGRRFLSDNSDAREPVENPFFAHFWIDEVCELWYRARSSHMDILVRHHKWRGFCDGGTLRNVIEKLRDFIMAGTVPRIWFSEHWGYDEDIHVVAAKVKALLDGYDPEED